jgi:long-chain acyl-CoA synthetase
MPERPWLQHYPQDVPHELSILPETLLTVFSRSIRQFARRPAVSYAGASLSYEKLGSVVDRFARGLAAVGIRRGDRVALCLTNVPQAVISCFGIWKAGGIVVPCNPAYTEYELSNQLRDAGAGAVVVLDEMYQKVAQLGLGIVIVARNTDFMTALAKYFYSRQNHRPLPAIPFGDKTVLFADLLDLDRSAMSEFPPVTPDDVAVLQYTGGTTGVLKGAELCHRNLTANIQQLVSWFAPSEGAETFLAALPLFHVFGFTVTQNICLAIGGRMLLAPNPRDVHALLTLIRKFRPSVVALVPALARKLLEVCHAEDLASARFCIIGGSPLQYELLKKFKERTGQLLVEGYGLSEASPVTHCNIPHGLSVKRSIGLPIPNTDARVVDEAGQDMPAGQVGELWVHGPQVMRGYWNNPEETAIVLKPGGWLATGDLARMDEDGFFFIVDRKKDMILSTSGFNVYPAEIERALLLHPLVKEAAVIGVPLADGSETVKAFVVPKEHPLSVDELLAHCRHYLASYKVPKKIEFRAEVPRTTNGRILYRTLRKEEEERLTAARAEPVLRRSQSL